MAEDTYLQRVVEFQLFQLEDVYADSGDGMMLRLLYAHFQCHYASMLSNEQRERFQIIQEGMREQGYPLSPDDLRLDVEPTDDPPAAAVPSFH